MRKASLTTRNGEPRKKKPSRTPAKPRKKPTVGAIHLKDILTIADEAVIVVDPDHIIAFFNRGAEKIFGFNSKEIVGQPLDRLMPTRFVADHRRYMHSFEKAPEPSRAMGQRGRIWGRRKDGSEFPAEASITKWRTGGKTIFSAFLRDVTVPLKMEREVERTKSILETQNEVSPDAMLLVDENGAIVFHNRRFLEMWGISEEYANARIDEPVLQTVVAQMAQPEAFLAKVRYLYDHKEEESHDELRTNDGRVIDRFSAPVISPAGEYYGRVWYFSDTTERTRIIASLRRANRALRVLSATNHVLIRAETERDLLDGVCRVIVEIGKYRMAWVGILEHDEYRSVRSIAQAGFEDGYLDGLAISWGDNERGRGPTGTAARTGVLQISRSIASDSKMAPWRADALKRGYASSIAIPMVAKSEVVGVLSIYAPELDAFDSEETKLLQELADDLAFGIVTQRSSVEGRHATERAERLANFDTVTGLPNRSYFTFRLQEALADALIDGARVVLMSMEIDRFDRIQDAIGIAGVDGLLQKIAERLRSVVDNEYLMARIGDETFAVLTRFQESDDARNLAKKIQAAMNEPFEHAAIPITVQGTIGVAEFPRHGSDSDALLVRSAIAVRQARAANNDFAVYSGKTDAESMQQLALLGELRQAIKANALELHYQPKIDLHTGKISGVEALIRWRRSNNLMVPPSQFIPLAESTGLIKPLTYWVLNAARRQIDRWHADGHDIRVAVNVSSINLQDSEFFDRVAALQSRNGTAFDHLDMEITETALMEDPTGSHDTLARIRDLGIDLFIDDFGTGYSSLSYIATLPVQALKIDRSFVLRMMQQAEHRAVVAAAISLAHTLGLKVVAEGIETKEQAIALMQQGCDEIQGYLYSPALPPDEFLQWKSTFKWKPWN